MEYHFNSTPYHYCFNNPINFIDPFGMDTTYVAPPIPELIIVGPKPSFWERLRNGIRNFFAAADDAAEGEGGTQPYGIPLVTSSGGASPTKQKAGVTGQEIDFEELQWALGMYKEYTGFPTKGERSYMKSVAKGTKLYKIVKDKQIKEATGDQTDAHGQPINETNNAQGQTTNPQGQESDSTIIQNTLIHNLDGDSSLVQDRKVVRNSHSNSGRDIGKPYKVKGNVHF